MQQTTARLLLCGSAVMFVLALLAPIVVSQGQLELVAAGATTPPATVYAYLKQVKLADLIHPIVQPLAGE